ncbi:DUF2529 family protein [Caldibacillus thermoamylovorans]|uniref:DUF2529 family protein n=1 Tax=Caldibacillus thermoamylovorans TaxID=35841 RepID=UPI00203D2976|nr:DUF2529 family protein [Caldibacillus thermoamylovorans]MCM3476820.1 DUF2529 domain-containing protein [Caldibacillus thermoamylovorans]
MSKIFTTQLIGRLQKISEQELDIEDAARLLAQALVGEGSIYIFGENDLRSVFLEAKYGQEPLQRVQEWTGDTFEQLSTADRVLIFSRNIANEQVVVLAKKLRSLQVPFVVVGSISVNDVNPVENLADVCINLHIDTGLVPDERGGRTMYPHAIAALYVYHSLKFRIDEIMEDYAFGS